MEILLPILKCEVKRTHSFPISRQSWPTAFIVDLSSWCPTPGRSISSEIARDGRAAGLWFVVTCPAGKKRDKPMAAYKTRLEAAAFAASLTSSATRFTHLDSGGTFPLFGLAYLGWLEKSLPARLTTLGGRGGFARVQPFARPYRGGRAGAGSRAIATPRAKSHQQILDFQKTFVQVSFFPESWCTPS